MLSGIRLRYGLHWRNSPACHMTNIILATITTLLVLTVPIATIEYIKHIKKEPEAQRLLVVEKEQERAAIEAALIRCLNEQVVTDYKDERGMRNLVMCKGVKHFEGKN